MTNADHIIDFNDTGFGIQHPAPCRPNLLSCPFQAAAQRLDGPPVAPGRYVCVLDPWGELSIQREASAEDVLAITGVVIPPETLERVLGVLRYVSSGHKAIHAASYPDATARRAMGELEDAIANQPREERRRTHVNHVSGNVTGTVIQIGNGQVRRG